MPAAKLARLLAGRGDLEELRARADAGLDRLRARVDIGGGYAARRLAKLLAERGDLDGLRARVADDDEAGPLAALLIVKGCGEEEERLRRFGLNPDGSIAGA